MKTILFITLILAIAFSQKQPGCQNKTFTPVDISLEEYSGRWYEVYATKNVHEKFEKGCTCTYAEYGVINPTKVSVDNTCYNIEDNKSQTISGSAKVTGPGSLDVSFFWYQFWESPYQVVQIQGDYEVAIVVSCNPYENVPLFKDFGGDFIWILSREPELTQEQQTTAFKYLTDNGFLISSLDKTVQGQVCESQY